MSDNAIKIKNVSVQERCDVCHQSDMFDPETKFCARCQHIALVKAIETPKVNAAPLPEFLARRLSSNVAIRCSNCGEFIMSRSPNCRHCGTYVRFDEAAQAAQDERSLTEAFESLHLCKAASSLSWGFLRLHLWGFPLTLLVTPLSAIGSLVLMLRTFWLSFLSLIKLSRFSHAEDPRISEGRRDAVAAAGKSLGAFVLAATVGVVVVYSGVMAIPRFWDNYAKGRHEYDMRRYKDAETLFQKAIAVNPNNIDAHLYYARAIWNQYINDINADKERNKEISARAIFEFRAVIDKTQDLKVRDEVYSQLAEIYKTLNNRQEFEQWMLARAKLPNQSRENQVDSYLKLGTAYANDVTSFIDDYVVKDVYPRVWRPVTEWKPEDFKKVKYSATKAVEYLEQALAIDPQHDLALPMRNQLNKEFIKINLKLDEEKRNPFADTETVGKPL